MLHMRVGWVEGWLCVAQVNFLALLLLFEIRVFLFLTLYLVLFGLLCFQGGGNRYFGRLDVPDFLLRALIAFLFAIVSNYIFGALTFLLFVRFFLSDFLLVLLSTLSGHLILGLVEAEQLAVGLHELLSEAVPGVEFSASVDQEHLVGFGVGDVPYDEIFDNFGRGDAVLFNFGDIESADVDGDLLLDIAAID